mgnify:CR=1 FL=1
MSDERTQGRIEAIFVTSEAGAPMRSVDAVDAVTEQGLAGDRYQHDAGTFSGKPSPKQQVTLIEWEAIEAVRRDYGLELEPAKTRRNLLTRGLALNHLVGATFRVGDAVFEGLELCEPCGHMEGLSGVEGARKALVHRGGLRCRVVEGGRIAVGDAAG